MKIASNSAPSFRLEKAKEFVVDVRKDHQLVMLLEIAERGGRIVEGRPVLHGAPIVDAFVPADGDAPILGEALVDDPEDFPVVLRRRLQLLCGFVARVGLEDFVARKRPPDLRGELSERREHAALPVDERAVAIEGQHFEVGQTHAEAPVKPPLEHGRGGNPSAPASLRIHQASPPAVCERAGPAGRSYGRRETGASGPAKRLGVGRKNVTFRHGTGR